MSASKPDKPADKQSHAGAFIIPSHGHGRLIPARKGEVRNPTGRSGRYGEVVKLAQGASIEALQVLITIALDPSEDARARIVACQEILGRAYGRIRAEVKAADGPATLDASKLTDRELEILWKLARTAKPDGMRQ